MKFIDVMTSLKNRNYLNYNIKSWEDNTIYPQTIVIVDLNNMMDNLLNEYLSQKAKKIMLTKLQEILQQIKKKKKKENVNHNLILLKFILREMQTRWLI